MDNQERASSSESRSLKRRYGTVDAVKGISFDIKEGEFYTLLGPSGCGKTTTLRCLAGLERADGGEVFIRDRLVDDGRVFIPPISGRSGWSFSPTPFGPI